MVPGRLGNRTFQGSSKREAPAGSNQPGLFFGQGWPYAAKHRDVRERRSPETLFNNVDCVDVGAESFRREAAALRPGCAFVPAPDVIAM